MPLTSADARFLGEVLANDNYRFRMALKPGRWEEYFVVPDPEVLRLRQHFLTSNPYLYVACLPHGEAPVKETLGMAGIGYTEDCLDGCIKLGMQWEPDFLLLDADLTLQAGCVCFPSTWALTEKVGLKVWDIHSPVPTLNAELGDSVNTFLTRLKPGAFWTRTNWGLSRSNALNQHPSQEIPRLDETSAIEDVWLRVEYQGLTRLPHSGAILFLIRVLNFSLAEVVEQQDLKEGVIFALKTMPESVAVYKGIARSRNRLLTNLLSS